MDRLLPTLIVGGVVLALLALMLLAWRRRVATAGAVSLPTALEQPGERVSTLSDLFYVATTLAESPLERVAIRGLRFRGFATVALFEEGIVISVRGEDPCAIQRAKIRRVSTQQLTIDKVVEPDGLIAVQWMSELGELSSVFRVQNPEARAALLSLPTGTFSSQHPIDQEKL